MQTGLIAARGLQFWAVAVLFGGGGFAYLLGRTSPRGMALLRVAAVGAAVSGASWFAAVFVAIAGTPGSLVDADAWSAFAGAPFGPPWLLRLALLGLCLIAVVGRDLRLFMGLGMLLAVDQAWLGHAATAEGAAAVWTLGVYWLHVLCGFAWAGALVMLCVVAYDERRVPPDGLALFATSGIAIVGGVLASGFVNAALRGLAPADLVRTPYGRVLGVKIVLVAAMLGLALYHRAARRRRSGRLGATVGLETILGLAVLVVAALLGITSPA